MKKITLVFIIIMLPLMWVFSQADNEDRSRMRSIFEHTKVVTPELDSVLCSSLVNSDNPVALLFTFSGCMGCRIALKETLLPNYKQLKSKYGLEIICVSKDEGAYRKSSIREYGKYPFKLFFDINNNLFKHMPKVLFPPDGSRKKAWPTFVIFDSDYDYVEISPWRIEEIENAITRLMGTD